MKHGNYRYKLNLESPERQNNLSLWQLTLVIYKKDPHVLIYFFVTVNCLKQEQIKVMQSH